MADLFMDTYDVIILGAGINGCGIALELAERGQSVLVLDKGRIGGGRRLSRRG